MKYMLYKLGLPLFGDKRQEIKEAASQYKGAYAFSLPAIVVNDTEDCCKLKSGFYAEKICVLFVSECMCCIRQCFVFSQLYCGVCLGRKYNYKNCKPINVSRKLEGIQV